MNQNHQKDITQIVRNAVERYKRFMEIESFPKYILGLEPADNELNSMDEKGFGRVASASYDVRNDWHCLKIIEGINPLDYLLFHEFTHILDDEKFVANVLYDIDLAIFGCAALSCIMAYSEYLVARREAMDEFFKEFLKLGNDLLKFPPIKVDLPLELFQKILSEEWKNEVSYVLGTEKETKAVDEFKQWQLDSLRSNDSIDKK